MGDSGNTFTIFVVDDDEAWLRTMRTLLVASGYTDVRLFSDPTAVSGAMIHSPPDVVISDLSMPGMGGERLLAVVHEYCPDVPVLILTGSDSISDCERLLTAGACQYLTKPVKRRELAERLDALRAALDQDREAVPGMAVPVTLIRGGSCHDRSILAQALCWGRHNPCPMAEWLPSSSLRDVIGRVGDPGLLERVDEGTLFIADVGQLPPDLLDVLRRLVEHGSWTPSGGGHPKPFHGSLVVSMDARDSRRMGFITTSKQTTVIDVPSLADREEDAAAVASVILASHARRLDVPTPTLLPDGMAALKSIDCFGTLDRLQDLLGRVMDIQRGPWIGAAAIRAAAGLDEAETPTPGEGPAWHLGDTLPTLSDMQQALIEEALRRFKGNKTEAAKALGITRQALNSRLRTLTRKGRWSEPLVGTVP